MPRTVFSIFLSSTSQDLAPYRAKVKEMIERMRETAIAMETFGARPEKPLATCRKEVLACDALIVIVVHRYGWIPAKDDGGDGQKSITWWEVQWALDAGKPVYAFLLDPQASWSAQREQDRLINARTEDDFVEIGLAVRWLQEFRAFLDKQATRDDFSSPDDLSAKVATSLHHWLLEQAVAAVRASLPADRETRISLPPLEPTGANARSEVDELFWQEQVHLLTAQRIAGHGEGVRIALIAGQANVGHPALSGSSIKQFDVRSQKETEGFDDHTTAVAALLVGSHPANSYRGIAPKADLLVLQVLNQNSLSSTADILVALDAAIREGAHVACLPLGGTEASETDRNAYARAAGHGVAVVCAAGNQANDHPLYPAAYPDCISVAAVDAINELAAFSTFGDWVTTAAPGVNIPVAIGDAEYQTFTGTSFSCAIVAGAVALMRQHNPALSVPAIKEALNSVGPRVPYPHAAGKLTHFRMLNACSAVRAAGEAKARPPARRRKKAGAK